MSLTKAQRQAIWDKSGGRCWYCGCELPLRGWHVDHCAAIYRQSGGMWKPQNHTIKNMVPACAPCNLFKGVFSVEQFREEIAAQIDRARKSSVNFRTAERFGQLIVTNSPVIFWFERNEVTNK